MREYSAVQEAGGYALILGATEGPAGPVGDNQNRPGTGEFAATPGVEDGLEVGAAA